MIVHGESYDSDAFSGRVQPGFLCSCVMVISIGGKPSSFTLDQNIGEFVRTESDLSIPKAGKIYSLNEGNTSVWDEPTKK